jgi:hypothetical protein
MISTRKCFLPTVIKWFIQGMLMREAVPPNRFFLGIRIGGREERDY